MQQRRLAPPFPSALQDQLNGIGMRRWSFDRQDLQDPGLQFAGSVVLKQPVQTDDGGVQGMSVLASALKKRGAGGNGGSQPIGGAVSSGGSLLVGQRLDVGGIL